MEQEAWLLQELGVKNRNSLLLLAVSWWFVHCDQQSFQTGVVFEVDSFKVLFFQLILKISVN